jgi:hypothetical protein
LDGIGERCAELLCNGADWLDRRKEAVELLDERTLHRAMSVDLALAEDLPNVRGHYMCPLFLLEKGRAQSTNFDFKDEAGKSLALPTRRDNELVSTAVLQAAAEKVLDRSAMSEELWTSLAAIAQLEPGDAEAELLRFGLSGDQVPDDPAARALRDNDDFQWLAETLAASSVLIVPLAGKVGDRKIIKLSFDQDVDDLTKGSRRGFLRAGWSGYSFAVDSPFVGARSFHFEVVVPAGVELTRARLTVASRDRYGQATIYGPRQRMHLYVPEAEDQRTAVTALDLRLGRAGFATAAVVASGAVVAVLGLFVGLAGKIGEGASSAPSLLLALPGIIATLVLRVEEQTITSRLLAWSRGFLLVSALCAYGAALRLGVDPPTASSPVMACDLRKVWVPLLGLAVVAFVGLVLTRLAPGVPDEVDEW